MNVITKKSPTNATTGTSYLSMMTSNVTSNNIKRRESSMGEDSVSHDLCFMTFNDEEKKVKR